LEAGRKIHIGGITSLHRIHNPFAVHPESVDSWAQFWNLCAIESAVRINIGIIVATTINVFLPKLSGWRRRFPRMCLFVGF
jgi:hypothetical protein